ncbi:unnamed protein product [Choristocarpus tenellus]
MVLFLFVLIPGWAGGDLYRYSYSRLMLCYTCRTRVPLPGRPPQTNETNPYVFLFVKLLKPRLPYSTRPLQGMRWCESPWFGVSSRELYPSLPVQQQFLGKFPLPWLLNCDVGMATEKSFYVPIFLLFNVGGW